MPATITVPVRQSNTRYVEVVIVAADHGSNAALTDDDARTSKSSDSFRGSELQPHILQRLQ